MTFCQIQKPNNSKPNLAFCSFAVVGNVEMPSSVQTYLRTGTVPVMPLFYRMVLIYRSSLSDEMLCSMYDLFYPFPQDNNSTVHPTVTRVIAKKTDPSHKPGLGGNVRILRGAIFLQPPQMYHRIFWS